MMQKSPSFFTKAHAFLPTRYGNFTVTAYKDDTEREHLVVAKKFNPRSSVLVRIHSSCQTGDVFGSLRCDCGLQLEQALKMIEENGSGLVIYLYQEGRGIGLFNKIKAYALQEKGYDTVEANEKLGFPPDERDYHIAATILEDLGITKVSLLTNNPDKVEQLEKYGINVAKRISIEIPPNEYDKRYLITKKNKLHHKLNLV